MNTIFKYATAAALTGALALAAATPSEARYGRNAAAIGFGVGAVAGAAIASSAYNNAYYGYYGDPGYGYALRTGLSHTTRTATTPMRTSHVYVYAPCSSLWLRLLRWQDPHRTNNFSIELAALIWCEREREAALRGGFFFEGGDFYFYIRASLSSAPCRMNAAAC